VPFLHRARDTVVRELYEEHLKKRRLAQPECNNGIRDRDLKGQLRLGSKRAFNKTTRQAFGLEVVKGVVGISIGLREVSDWTLWMGKTPPKRKKRLPAV
jgi:hypothetical protein